MAAQRRAQRGAADAGARAGAAGVEGDGGFERAAEDGVPAALRGRPGAERHCQLHGIERGNGEGSPFAGAWQSARGAGREAMSEIEKKTVPAVDPAAEPGAELGAEPNVDPELGQALAHFRANAHAWS